ncbi:alginate O-acetyltransferase AlgF [Tropicibacter naphthalenivorans]|uniref:Alginate biosynthesis protein AlgF n=1 Tax=Tropicibacter naphthalenivorans TaxID=441103 RepID=A0A0P1GEY2_9RHOB|nr:alginate O-acetyltransferase AlgF [Tropicibacter naphthalenivorans]CUH80079.1 Alginate O-acetyl transferase AlgF [Tropicibacter naphthalenivorans]SMC84413.1 alginate O-acetyltransferase complex protein AlgF [Tropicibacter naphthalenivorans]
MMDRRTCLAALGALVALPMGLASPAHAGDGALYKDVFDPNSSFVRIVAPGQTFGSIDGKSLDALTNGVSGYVNVMPGAIPVVFSDGSLDVEVAPSKHYTVVKMEGQEPQVFEDALELSPAKADVSVVNLTTQGDVNLYVPLAKAVAIKAVPAADVRSIALKAPLTLDFDLRSGEDALASVAAVELKRKAGVTIVLNQTGAGYDAFAVANSYER